MSVREQSPKLEAYFEAVLRRGLYTNRRRLNHMMKYNFRDIPLAGRSMLDIGGGAGLMSLYAAASGARPVLNLEPLERHRATFEEIAGEIGLSEARFVVTTFQEFDPGDQRFDVILSHSSINHLDEEACVDLDRNQTFRRRYLEMLEKLTDMARPGAHLIVADCTNRNLFGDLGLTNPLARSIEWEKHQPPGVWAELLQQVGWIEPRVRWSSLNVLGRAGRFLMGNRVVNYLTLSHFCLTMRKGGRV
jgi:SAM-dependent methyltransferase